MGGCKDEMKATDTGSSTSSKKGGLFDKLRRGKKTQSVEEAAKTFADHLLVVEEKLTTLTDAKERDLDTEKNREDYNRRALGRLQTMAFHVEKVIELANEYNEDC